MLIAELLQATVIDDKFCISFAFPNSKLHLSTQENPEWGTDDPQVCFLRPENLVSHKSILAQEKENNGIFLDLKTSQEYWVNSFLILSFDGLA